MSELPIDEKSTSPFESPKLEKLFEALAKAQLEMEVAKNENINPFFKSRYSDLAGLVKASRPYLGKNGLCVIQRVLPDIKGQMTLFTRLCHASGQWIESKMAINPPKQDIQTIGSYITYLRRYNYGAIVGVVASDEDDDGEKDMEPARVSPVEKPPVALYKSSGKINKTQLQIISSELEGHEDILETVLSGFKIDKLSDIEEKNFVLCVTRIKEIKKTKESINKK